MVKFIARRMAQALIVIFLVTCITFFIMNLIPGGPFLSDKPLSPNVIATLEAKYGIDKPISVQLKNYVKHAIKGDLGVSMKMQRNRPVAAIIKEMFPVSAKIGIVSLLVAVFAGVSMGSIAACNRGNAVDKMFRVLATIGVSIPGFVVATSLLVIFGSIFKILPTVGIVNWKSYILPCSCLSIYPMCYIGRLTRAGMLDVLSQEYIRTARAKGLSNRIIILKHALRNAIIPVLAYIGPLVAYILSGSFVVETVFNIPGLGRYFIQSILNRDYTLIMGTTIFFASIMVLMNLVVDILYRVADPRIDSLKGGGCVKNVKKR